MTKICLFLASLLALQVSASSISLGRRQNPISHGPTSLGSIQSAGIDVANGIARRDNTIEEAISLLGSDAIIDCPGNSGTSYNESLAAEAKLLSAIGASGLSLDAGICRHVNDGSTIAKICNRGDDLQLVSYGDTKAAFDLLTETCSGNKASGTLKTINNIFFAVYARGKEGATSTTKRSTRTQNLQKRCTLQTNLPVTGCDEYVCDPAETLDSSGNCPWINNDETNGCTSYCEIRASKYYGVAETLDDTSFCSQSGCALSIGTSYTIEKSVSFDFGADSGDSMTAVLSLGIAFSYAVSKTTSTETQYTMDDGKCGQWYKVPILKASCGSVSEYNINFADMYGINTYCLEDASLDQTYGNVCAEMQSKQASTDESSAQPDVRIIARYANCDDSTFYADDDTENQNPSWVTAFGSGYNSDHTC